MQLPGLLQTPDKLLQMPITHRRDLLELVYGGRARDLRSLPSPTIPSILKISQRRDFCKFSQVIKMIEKS